MLGGYTACNSSIISGVEKIIQDMSPHTPYSEETIIFYKNILFYSYENKT